MGAVGGTIAGPAGPTGPTGATGPSGSQGPSGSSGPIPVFNTTPTTLDLTGFTQVGGYDFEGLGSSYTGSLFANVTLTGVDDIQYVGSYAFNSHAALTGSITFPKLKYIGYFGFRNSSTNVACPSFTSFTAPSCSRVGINALQNNKQLVSASIGTATTLEFIGGSTFSGDSSLKYVYIPTLSGSGALGGSPANNSVFTSVAVSGSITIPSFYSSSNAGSPDGDLASLISNGWNVTYV
jgi:hypothetical protein